MLSSIYWILAILVMLLLLINAIRTIKSDIEFRKYIKKQNAILDRQMQDIFLRDLKEIGELLKSLKNESEDK